MLGPGRYDDLCNEARRKSGAVGAALIIFGGKDGHGFSVQAPIFVLNDLPGVLRYMADEIEKDLSSRVV